MPALDRAVVDRATRVVDGSVRIVVSAKPKSAKEGLEVGKDGGLVVRVRAAPEDGKANARIVDVVADLLDVAKRQVHVVRGDTARHKELAVHDLALEIVRDRLCAAG